MSNDKTAEDFLKEKGIIKEGYSKWICRFEDGKEFDIGELFHEYSAQQLKEYKEVIRELSRARKLIDQTDSTKP